MDLLDPETFDRCLTHPKWLDDVVREKYEWILIDEVQRVPRLLDSVHRLIEESKQKFALSGSSSRKLRRGGANLLAGRAFVNNLHPLTQPELGAAFNLDEALRWGTLPRLQALGLPEEKKAYLRSYTLTYIQEEIQAEQIVRRLQPFREFLRVAAQMSGKILNYSAIGREVGAQVPTVQTYFQILEDTFAGFWLPHFHRSVRKSQLSAPKFYLFDHGVKRALEGSLDSPPTEGTSYYGEIFEAFVIQEIYRLNDSLALDFRLSYFRTKNDAEVDLVLTKGKITILVEIKSSRRVDRVEVRKLSRMRELFGKNAVAYCLSQDPVRSRVDDVLCLPWQEFLKLMFEGGLRAGLEQEEGA